MDAQTTLIANNSFFLNGMFPLLMIFMIWDMVWKGIALWKAGTKKQLVRFVCLLVLNTFGILPIIYLIFFQKKETIEKVKMPVTIIKIPSKEVKVLAKAKITKKK